MFEDDERNRLNNTPVDWLTNKADDAADIDRSARGIVNESYRDHNLVLLSRHVKWPP